MKPLRNVRIIGLDLDGTVFDSKKHISPRTLAAIEAAARQGILVLPATGRPLSGVPETFLHIPGVRYALTSNGATVTELATGKALVRQGFTDAQARQIFALLCTDDCILDVFIDGESYTTRKNLERMADYAPPEILPYLRASRLVVDDMQALMDAHPGGVEKFSILYNDLSVRAAAWQRVTAAGPVEATASFSNNMELNAPGVDKGEGLLALARYLGFGPEAVMACGDSGNDVAMLKKVGFAVAMGNAEPEVKAAADYVTLDNDHDGVAAALEALVLASPA